MTEQENASLEQARAWIERGDALKAFYLLKRLLAEASEELEQRDIWRVHELIGACFHDMADPEGAAQAYFRAAQSDRFLRSQRQHFSNYLFLLHYLPYLTDEILTEQHGIYADLYREENPLPMPEERAEHTRLRIGYLAPDFREQAVSRFAEPMLTQWDREHFDVYCYSLSRKEDSFTEKIRASVTCYREMEQISFEETAQQIQRDEIDILFDLGGHSAGGMTLPILAYRAAPVQISGIGYFNTTGLSAVDYFLTDLQLDPEGSDAAFTEQLLRLPSAFAFQPTEEMRSLSRNPREIGHPLQLGGFHNFMKLNDEVLQCFGRILQALPEARLLLQDTVHVPERRSCLLQRIRELGLPEERVEVRMGTDDYLRMYQDVDIMLDTWPYPGGVMTATALYMGVPVVTRSGTRHGSRFGNSILTAADRSEWIADSEERYCEIVLDMAQDPGKLAALQQELRSGLEHSQLLDTRSWMQDLENEYERIWKERTGEWHGGNQRA